MLEYLKKKYEDDFRGLVGEVQGIGSKLLVLYIPSANPNSLGNETCRIFFRDLTNKYRVDYLDLSERFFQYPGHWVRLYPQDAHLSRFGNKLIVEELSSYLDKYSEYKITRHFQKRPSLFGALKPHSDSIWEMKGSMPFRVITNNQGLRMKYKLTFPKTKQRILVLGDSYTFGPYLDNHDVYPNMLDNLYPDKEVINAGVATYTILEELALFRERAKYVEPDIVILQVFKNDLSDLFFFTRNLYPELKSRSIEPSAVEIEFLKKLGFYQ